MRRLFSLGVHKNLGKELTFYFLDSFTKILTCQKECSMIQVGINFCGKAATNRIGKQLNNGNQGKIQRKYIHNPI